MGWFEGVLSGFQGRHYDLEEQQLREAHLRNQRESQIFERLLTSPDDEIKALAATGLLTSAQNPKRKGGFRGWLGEVEQNPLLDQIKALIGTSKQSVVPGLSSTQYSGGVLPEAYTKGAQAAALPATSPTQAGAAAMATPQPWVNPGPWRGGLGDTEQAPEALRPPADDLGALAQVGAPPPEPFMGPRLPNAATIAAPTAGDVVAADVGASPPEPQMTVGGTEEQPELRFEAPEETVVGTAGTVSPIAASPVGGPPPVPESVSTTRTSTSPERVESTPRQIFQTPEGQLRLNTLAREQAEYDATYAYYRRIGFSDDEIKKMLQEGARRTTTGRGAAYTGQSVPGEWVNEDGTFEAGYASYDKGTQKYVDPWDPTNTRRFRPRTVTASTPGYGADREAIAKAEYGKPFRELTQQQAQRVIDLEEEQVQAEAAARSRGTAGAEATNPLSREKVLTVEDETRREYRERTKGTTDAGVAVQAMRTAYDNAIANPTSVRAANEAIMVLWEKALDENSVVREAEFARIAQFQGLGDRIRNFKRRLLEGGGPLSTQELEEYVNLAETIQAAREWKDQQLATEYEDIAKRRGLDVRNIIPGYKPRAAPADGAGGGTAGAGGGGATAPNTAPGGDTWETNPPGKPPGLYRNGVKQ